MRGEEADQFLTSDDDDYYHTLSLARSTGPHALLPPSIPLVVFFGFGGAGEL